MKLYYFLLGLMFIQWGVPLVDSLIELFTTWIESLKGKIGIRITKYNAEIQKITDEIDKPIEGHLIGFQVDSSSEEEEEEYEDDD